MKYCFLKNFDPLLCAFKPSKTVHFSRRIIDLALRIKGVLLSELTSVTSFVLTSKTLSADKALQQYQQKVYNCYQSENYNLFSYYFQVVSDLKGNEEKRKRIWSQIRKEKSQ
jgi:hypothetical protein